MDLLKDNDDIFRQKEESFLSEAITLLEAPRSPSLPASEATNVVSFLTDAILACNRQSPQRGRAMSALATLLLPGQSKTPCHRWVRVAARVVANVADHAQDL